MFSSGICLCLARPVPDLPLGSVPTLTHCSCPLELVLLNRHSNHVGQAQAFPLQLPGFGSQPHHSLAL